LTERGRLSGSDDYALQSVDASRSAWNDHLG
jgi:hypothetical protein